METNLIKHYQNDYYKGLISFKDAVKGELKFYYSSYFLQKNKHNKQINVDLFIYSLIRPTMKLREKLIVFNFIPTIPEYRRELLLLSEIIKSCHQELVQMFKNGNVNDNSIEDLIRIYFAKSNVEMSQKDKLNVNDPSNNYNSNFTSLQNFNNDKSFTNNSTCFNSPALINNVNIESSNKGELEQDETLQKCKEFALYIGECVEFKKRMKPKNVKNFIRFIAFLYHSNMFAKTKSARELIEEINIQWNFILKIKSYQAIINNPGYLLYGTEKEVIEVLILFEQFAEFFQLIGYTKAFRKVQECQKKLKPYK